MLKIFLYLIEGFIIGYFDFKFIKKDFNYYLISFFSIIFTLSHVIAEQYLVYDYLSIVITIAILYLMNGLDNKIDKTKNLFISTFIGIVICMFDSMSILKIQVSVTVGDETLHTVQAPAVVCLIVSSLQHHTLQVGTCIRFCQVHRHGFTGTDTRDESAVLVLITELIQGFDTVLQWPDVTKTGIRSSHDFGTHGIRSNREVQTTETARHRHTVQVWAWCEADDARWHDTRFKWWM